MITARAYPAGPVWALATTGALVLHLAIAQQFLHLAAPGRMSDPVTLPDIEIMAVPLAVAGQDTPVAVAERVTESESQAPVSDAETLTMSNTDQDRIKANDAESASASQPRAEAVAAVRPDAPATAPRQRVAARPEPVPQDALRAPVVAAPRVTAPAASAAPARVPTLRAAAPKPVERETATAVRVPATPSRVTAVKPAPEATPSPSEAPAPETAPVRTAPTPAAPPRVVAARPAPAASRPARVSAVPRATVAATPPAATEEVAALPSLPPVSGAARPGIAAPTPEVVLPATPTETYETTLDVLASYAGGPCFAALPTLGDDGAFQLETFARSRSDLDKFRGALETRTGALPDTRMKPVSDAQCEALAYLQNSPAYPQYQIFFDLKAYTIPSGSVLEGKIGNTGGGFLSFLIIDDEGLVQDLGSFLRFTRGAALFRIPMTIKGSPVETQQLLMALSTPARLETVQAASGTPARQFFAALEAELRRKGVREDLAMVAFSVK
jgi:hypothetical protein